MDDAPAVPVPPWVEVLAHRLTQGLSPYLSSNIDEGLRWGAGLGHDEKTWNLLIAPCQEAYCEVAVVPLGGGDEQSLLQLLHPVTDLHATPDMVGIDGQFEGHAVS